MNGGKGGQRYPHPEACDLLPPRGWRWAADHCWLPGLVEVEERKKKVRVMRQ